MNAKPKQRAVRVRSTLKVTFRELENDFLSGSTGKNISETGLCIPLTHVPESAFLEMKIHSSEFATVKATARIAWIVNRKDGIYPFEAGLEFLDLGPAERDILHAYIARATKDGESPEIRWID